MERRCSKTLDKPILLLGLDVEELVLLFFVSGLGGLLMHPFVSGAGIAAGWGAILRLKKNKPQGYVLHWLYSHGLRLPGLISPPVKVNQYGAYGSCDFTKFAVR